MALLLDDATDLIHGHGFAIMYGLRCATKSGLFGVHGAESSRIVALVSNKRDRTPVSYEVKQGGEHRPEFTVTEASTIASHHPGDTTWLPTMTRTINTTTPTPQPITTHHANGGSPSVPTTN